jgi:uncharacterized membrane protein
MPGGVAAAFPALAVGRPAGQIANPQRLRYAFLKDSERLRMSDDAPYDLTPPSDPSPPPSSQRSPAPTPNSTGSSDAGAYEIASPPPALKPGDPGWVPPTVIVEKEVVVEPEEPPAPPPDPDVEKFKGMAILAYICFLIPLLAAPQSKFARFHANQGLLSFLTLVIIVFVVSLLEVGNIVVYHFLSEPIHILYLFFSCGFHLLELAALIGWIALTIAGIVHAANGEKKELPVVGHWTLIK